MYNFSCIFKYVKVSRQIGKSEPSVDRGQSALKNVYTVYPLAYILLIHCSIVKNICLNEPYLKNLLQSFRPSATLTQIRLYDQRKWLET